MPSKTKQTPLMKQYDAIKAKYPETVLLFRLGDFYETFNDDALITAQACGIALTKRNNGAAGSCPLAGFPYHQLDSYLPKLVRAGYRVAVCEQLEDPKKAKGIVKRGVVEVVTPGVAMYDRLLDTKSNNYLASIYIKKEKTGLSRAGIAFCDISTGQFQVSQFPISRLAEIAESFNPKELLGMKSHKNEINDLAKRLSNEPPVTLLEDWIFDDEFTRDILLKHFKTQNLKGFGIDDDIEAQKAAGAIMHYISETQADNIEHIQTLHRFDRSGFMLLDNSARRNLEILYSIENQKDGSLLNIIDRTKTAMGGRLLKNWIARPLTDLDRINQRLDSVNTFFENFDTHELLRNRLNEIGDLERLISKISSGRCNPRDVVSLKDSIALLPEIKQIISEMPHESLKRLSEKIILSDDLTKLIEESIIDDPSTNIGSGKVFRQGYNQELDSYIDAKFSGKNWIKDYQEQERKSSGIPSLKVGYNSVFGYYIEITKVHSSKAPEHYQRKQTLTNSERYTTDKLNEIEEKILHAEEKISELESRLFAELNGKIAAKAIIIQQNANIIAIIDCLQGFAQASRENNYCRPQIDESGIIDIEDGRHPVVEKLLPVGDSFVPNSTKLDPNNDFIHIITGPNMSGKSSYLRQVALIVLMGQVGCFVPARSAKFGVVDRIFTRVGAQDNISAGESTFLVEMQEAANILNNATDKSLILLDEVGRGTATFDGISIAWSIAEHLHERVKAKTLFATHYHELNELAARYEKINNYKVEVIEADGSIIFSHNLRPGSSDYSFGIHVAQMAGLPYDVIKRANEIMSTFESNAKNKDDNEMAASIPDTSQLQAKTPKPSQDGQLAIFEFRDDEIRARLKELEIENITPVQALSLLAELKREAEKDKD